MQSNLQIMQTRHSELFKNSPGRRDLDFYELVLLTSAILFLLLYT